MQNSRPPSEPRKDDVAVVLKAFDLLEALSHEGRLGLRAISDRAGVSKASAYRVLNTLVRKGYVAKSDNDRTYTVGPRLLALSSKLVTDLTLAARAHPVLEELHAELGETVNLGTLSGSEVLYLDMIESRHGLRMAARAGQRDPVHSTALGKAILSRLEDAEIDRLLANTNWRRRTANTITNKSQLRKELDATRARGFAIDNEENEFGACCVAVPILNQSGGCREAISISGPRLRISDKLLKRIGRRLQVAARDIAIRLGYTSSQEMVVASRKGSIVRS